MVLGSGAIALSSRRNMLVPMSDAMAVILAAGEGKRLGAGIPKAMLEFEGGKSFLGQLASVFGKAGCGVLPVIGASAGDVEALHPRLSMLRNEDWQEGQFSSVRAGIKAALDEGAQVVVIHPVDMPFIRAGTVTSLMKALGDSEAIIPEFEGAVGHPLVLSRPAAEAVLKMSDVPHMEAALQKLKTKKLSVKDPAVLLDVNTPDIHQRLFDRAPRAAPPPKRRAKSAS